MRACLLRCGSCDSLATDGISAPIDLSSQNNPAREPLTQKCVRVIIENFERLPAHDAAGGMVDFTAHDANEASREYQRGQGDPDTEGTTARPVADTVVSGKGADGSGWNEAKSGSGEDAEAGGEPGRQGQRNEVRGIPAKFLQAISAGLSTSLDPKVR